MAKNPEPQGTPESVRAERLAKIQSKLASADKYCRDALETQHEINGTARGSEAYQDAVYDTLDHTHSAVQFVVGALLEVALLLAEASK